MRNKILIMTTVIIAISLILFAFLFFKNKKNSSVSSGTPTGSMILLSTKDSNVNVPVNNYYTAPAVTVIY